MAQWADIEGDFGQWKTIADHIQLLLPEYILVKYPSIYVEVLMLFWYIHCGLF